MSELTADVRYPIGQFQPKEYDDQLKVNWARDIKFLPNDLELAIQNLDEFQLNTPYRDGGWSVKQVVHHLADSHMHAYTRFKFALTEDNPTIKGYDEKAWSELPDVFDVPENVSITLLHALHRRWTALIDTITEEQFKTRSVYHSGYQKQMTLWTLLGMYSWHGRHHVAHINALKERKGW